MAKRKANSKAGKPISTPQRRREKHTQPRAAPLPGLEGARIRELDEICASLGDTRAQMNDLRQEGRDLEQHALALLQEHGKQSWRHAGVELVRVPGEEKLRVRMSKAAATAEVENSDDETPKQATVEFDTDASGRPVS